MFANAALPNPAPGAHPFSLNDLRVHNANAEEPPTTSALRVSSLALAVVLALVLAIGAFIWLDPLRLFTPTEASPPAPAFVPSAEPARPTERQEIIAPLTPVPATKSVEVPIAPAPAVQAPHVPAPVVRPRAASIKPQTRGNPMDKTNTTVLQASPKETTAPPELLAKPEETTDAPIVPKLGDDTKNTPKPAATNDQTPVPD